MIQYFSLLRYGHGKGVLVRISRFAHEVNTAISTPRLKPVLTRGVQSRDPHPVRLPSQWERCPVSAQE